MNMNAVGHGARLSRRSFLKGGVVLASAAAVTGLAGCATSAQEKNPSAKSTGGAAAYKADETMECDIVIVGAGPAGLSAAIEAGESGASVVVLESLSVAGGNFDGTEGVLGVNTPAVKKHGYECDPMDIINNELSKFTYRVDALKWIDFIEASTDNIAWLEQHGMVFRDEPVDYSGRQGPKMMHLYAEDSKPSKIMTAAAEAAGAQIMTSTPARALIKSGDAVAGVYAEREGGSILEIACKAVIIATGGYVGNAEMVKRVIHQDLWFYRATGSQMGDGINMAIDAGAKSMLSEKTLMGYPATLIETNMAWYDTWDLMMSGLIVWVNQDGQRFTDEGICKDITMGLGASACLTQKKTFTLCDDAVLSVFDETFDQRQFLDGGIEAGEKHVWKGDSWEELAKAAGLDPKALEETVNGYNSCCEVGKDEVFHKNPDYLMPLSTPPYYLVENGYYITTTIGGLDYDRSCRVLDDEDEPIPGLYVAGVDGAQLFKNFYTIDTTSATAMGNNIYTGRIAAQTAAADFLA